MVRVLITGGAGFIGSHLAEHHLKKGDDVWILDNFLSGKKENISLCMANSRFRFSEFDLNVDPIQEPIEWAESIYHLAAVVGYHIVLKKPLEALLSNIRTCENIFTAVSQYNPKAKILIASSSEVYGNEHAGLLSEELPICFSNVEKTQKNYALSKYVNEMTALTFMEEKGLFTVIARIFNTSGSRQGKYSKSAYVMPSFIEKALTQEKITVYGSGKQTRSFCSVHDTVKMLDLFLHTTTNSGEILNIGNDQEISIDNLASLIRTKALSNSEIVYVPYYDAYGRNFTETMRRRPDLQKMKRILKYSPEFTIEMIIDEMIKNYT